jgi:deoxyribodipyrimidine photo-lyase
MTDTSPPVIYWFRQDLRLNDLPALQAAAASGQPVIPCYIHDPDSAGAWAPGAASRWWLHHSLESLARDIDSAGGRLLVLQGDTRQRLLSLADAVGATGIYASRCHEPWAAALEQQLHSACEKRELPFKRFPGSLLFEPEQVLNQSGGPFKVFTPYWKACLRQPEPRAPRAWNPRGVFQALDVPADITGRGDSLAELELLPVAPDWASHWSEFWQPGEAGARARLNTFLETGIRDYSEGRNHPARDSTSRLSPHVHFGEISPRQIWHAAQHARAANPGLEEEIGKFLSELGWREFSHHLLHHFPHIPEQPFKPVFANFPWLGDRAALRAWQQGQTGYPIVDAGMRELWHTGYMHNRVRMIVASFLTKHLLLPWRAGEDWFWDTLVDADLANNACGWQWVAGSGADASPYFRIFNPTLQGEKFDGQGDYTRHWVPELAGLPDRYLQEPARAPAEVLQSAGVRLGENYPHPIVDHKEARAAALAAYGSIKGG